MLTKFELIYEGKLVNQHSKDDYDTWGNPVDMLPPVGSIIEYMTFNQGKGYKEGLGVLTKYLVKGYIFTTEESWNSSYDNKVCKILVDVIA